MPYTSANGYMLSFINKDGELGGRLPKDKGAKLVEQFDTGPFLSHGATMKEYLVILEDKLSDTDLICDLLNQAHDYVNSLPPK